MISFGPLFFVFFVLGAPRFINRQQVGELAFYLRSDEEALKRGGIRLLSNGCSTAVDGTAPKDFVLKATYIWQIATK
jgi:hypothetical protein